MEEEPLALPPDTERCLFADDVANAEVDERCSEAAYNARTVRTQFITTKENFKNALLVEASESGRRRWRLSYL